MGQPVEPTAGPGTVPTEEDMKVIRAVKDEELPWLPGPPDGAGGSKLLVKMKENPFVPIGEQVLGELGRLAYMHGWEEW